MVQLFFVALSNSQQGPRKGQELSVFRQERLTPPINRGSSPLEDDTKLAEIADKPVSENS